MNLQTIFITLSLIFGLITPIIGITSIFKGVYKPQRMTKFIYLIISVVIIASMVFSNDTSAIYLALVQGLATLGIFTLSLKYGVGGVGKLDLGVLVLALLAIVGWKTTNNPFVGLYLSVFADAVGIIPTLPKIYKDPHSEEPFYYISDIVSGFFSCLALVSVNEFGNIEKNLFPVYILLLNLVVFLIITIRRKALKNKNSHLGQEQKN